MMSALKSVLKNAYASYVRITRAKKYRAVMASNCKNYSDSLKPLTDEEVKEIKEYWKQYDYVPDLNAFKWFYNVSGIHNPHFITEDFYACHILTQAYSERKATDMDDKNFYDLYFHDVKMPETIIRNDNGVFLDKNYRIISKTDALKIVKEHTEKVVIKPTVDSCKGQGVQLIEPADIEIILSGYTKNYIVQKKVKQCDAFAALNESSANVVRITSVLVNGKVYLLSPTIRVGDEGRFIDQGGKREFCIGIDENGKLKDYGLATKCSITPENTMPNGYIFGGGEYLPGFSCMKELTTKLHPRLACFPIIGWDFITDKTGEVYLIECNLHWSGIVKYQECNGPLMGEHTDEILRGLGM